MLLITFHPIPISSPSARMTLLTFETLPTDVLADILSTFDDFEDLQVLLRSSAICWRVFNEHTASIAGQVAKNILGIGVWDNATKVLIYQRTPAPPTKEGPHTKGENTTEIADQDYATIERDLKGDFVFQRQDIANLVANQQFFVTCAAGFTTLLRLRPKPYPFPTFGDIAMDTPLSQSFVAGDVLQIKFFYEMWLLSYQFGHSSIEDFAQLEPLSEQRMADLDFLSRSMSTNRNLARFVPQPRWKTPMPRWRKSRHDNCKVAALWYDLFGRMRGGDWFWDPPNRNRLLLLKMTSHLGAAITIDNPACPKADFWRQMNNLEADYLRMGVAEIVEKYRLSRAWK